MYLFNNNTVAPLFEAVNKVEFKKAYRQVTRVIITVHICHNRSAHPLKVPALNICSTLGNAIAKTYGYRKMAQPVLSILEDYTAINCILKHSKNCIPVIFGMKTKPIFSKF